MVLHSGNHEIIGIRHRKTQTLYISHVIEPHSCSNPAYGKVQVGIYIAAIQDTIDRAMQGIEAREKSGRDPPADISLKDEEANLDGDPGDHPEGPTGSNKRNGSSGSKGEPQGKDEGKGKRPASRRVIDHPRFAPFLFAILRQASNCYNNFTGASGQRSQPKASLPPFLL